MSESFTDYDLEDSIRQVAARLQIAGCSAGSGKPLNELFSAIEERCPDAAEILLERTFEKDKLRDYLKNSPLFPTINGNIVGEGDPEFETRWNNLVNLYPQLLEAIQKCAASPAV